MIANASEAKAPTETKREGLRETQYAIVRTPANKKLERSAEMSDPHITKSKVCCHCKEEKPLELYYRNRSTKDGYMKQCKSCHSKAQMKWQSNNRDKANEIAARYNNGRRKDYIRENWHWLKIKRNISTKAWVEAHPDKRIEYKRKRRARIMTNSTSHFTAEEFRQVCEKYDNKCLCCGEVKPLEADHVVALVNGGGDEIDNIQPLCRICNARKARKTIDFRV